MYLTIISFLFTLKTIQIRCEKYIFKKCFNDVLYNEHLTKHLGIKGNKNTYDY